MGTCERSFSGFAAAQVTPAGWPDPNPGGARAACFYGQFFPVRSNLSESGLMKIPRSRSLPPQGTLSTSLAEPFWVPSQSDSRRAIAFLWMLGLGLILFLCAAGRVLASGYGILTTTEIRNASTQLAAFETHKTQRGYAVHTFDELDWGGSGLTGDAASEAMRTFLQTADTQYDLDYLLIVGDPRPTVGPVPMKTLYPRTQDDGCSFTSDPVPTDYYYATLNGNWDLDGDGRYGEFGTITGDFGAGGVDRSHENYVGRIPVYGTSNQPALFNQSIQDLDHILSKTMAYQNEPDISWRNDVMIAVEGANRVFYGEQIKDDLLDPNGIGNYRVYDSASIPLPDPPDATICSIPNVKAGWDATNPGIVTWFTHGGGSGAAAVMNVATAATLDDNFPAMTWQASCLNSLPSSTNNLSYELLINGAIATVGFTAISHGPGSTVDLTSNAHLSGIAGLGYGYISRIALDGLTVGQALMELKRDSTIYNRCWYWHNHVGANLYGDPELSYYDQQSNLVPEPTAVMLIALGALGLMALGFPRRRK